MSTPLETTWRHTSTLVVSELDFGTSPSLAWTSCPALRHRPVDPAEGARALAHLQADIVAANRFGIPAIVHEECLTGFMTWKATVYPLRWPGRRASTRSWWRDGGEIGTAMRRSACTRTWRRSST